MSNLAAELLELRSERGWSQTELARRSGLGRTYLRDLESGYRGRSPSLRVLEELAKAFQVPPEHFTAYRRLIVTAHPDWLEETYRRHVNGNGAAA